MLLVVKEISLPSFLFVYYFISPEKTALAQRKIGDLYRVTPKSSIFCEL